MTITKQIQIGAATDTCSVSRQQSGAITIGSVRLKDDAEAAEFPAVLAQAIQALQEEERKSP